MSPPCVQTIAKWSQLFAVVVMPLVISSTAVAQDAATLMAGGSQITTKVEQVGANSARLMWSAFKCAEYSALSRDDTEFSRLFSLGYDAGKKFLERFVAKTLPGQELREAPIGVTMLLQGPSIDFIVGRIFENARTDAFDEVVKTDASDPSKWASDDGVIAIRANDKYRDSNCELLR